MTKILLVEDDSQIAAYLGELLRAEGFDTQIAGSKKEAGANAFWHKPLIWCSLM